MLLKVTTISKHEATSQQPYPFFWGGGGGIWDFGDFGIPRVAIVPRANWILCFLEALSCAQLGRVLVRSAAAG